DKRRLARKPPTQKGMGMALNFLPRLCSTLLASAALVGGSVGLSSTAAAQCAGTSCVVTSSADTTNGTGNPTLRDAIAYANTNPGTAITFSNALPSVLGNNTTINGSGANITVSGNSQFRVFFIGNASSAISAAIQN